MSSADAQLAPLQMYMKAATFTSMQDLGSTLDRCEALGRELTRPVRTSGGLAPVGPPSAGPSWRLGPVGCGSRAGGGRPLDWRRRVPIVPGGPRWAGKPVAVGALLPLVPGAWRPPGYSRRTWTIASRSRAHHPLPLAIGIVGGRSHGWQCVRRVGWSRMSSRRWKSRPSEKRTLARRRPPNTLGGDDGTRARASTCIGSQRCTPSGPSLGCGRPVATDGGRSRASVGAVGRGAARSGAHSGGKDRRLAMWRPGRQGCPVPQGWRWRPPASRCCIWSTRIGSGLAAPPPRRGLGLGSGSAP